VAHDFNNLLTAIEATHDLVRRYANDARVDRIMDVNKTALDRSRKLISQLLAFSRKQVLYPKNSSINDLISVFDVLLQKAVGEKVTFSLELKQDLATACIDQGQFQSALLNLVVNARDAMPGGGMLKVFTDRMSLTEANYPPPYDVPAGDYIVLGVSDNGRGMSHYVRAKAFEPFFTTKEPGAGSGLGLSQCYGFARQSGGTLVIESQEGQGTTVRLLLPALTTSATVAAQPSNRTILFVDDDLAVRVLVAEILRDLGHTVIEAEDAHDALQQLHNDVRIDFLFTDIIMPNGMDGLQLIAAARDIRPGLRALLASGYPRDVLRDLARLPDDVTYLAKPYSRSDLSANFGAYPPPAEEGVPSQPPGCR
jgi:nitrogen fixation/metabolism regulation signal transduction histidine kinase